MAALEVAGMAAEYSLGGSKLVVGEPQGAGVSIRNRGGEELANVLSGDHKIRVLDIRESGISDNGIAHICLALRRSDQIEELYLSNVGHHGFDFVLGVVQRCNRLRKLHVTVEDVQTKHQNRQTISDTDYDTADFEREKGEDEEEEEPEEGQPTKEQLRDEMKKVWDTGYDSEEDERRAKQEEAEAIEKKAKQNRALGLPVEEAPPEPVVEKKISPPLNSMLRRLIETASEKQNLIEIQCTGDCPPDIQYELERVVEEHIQSEEKKFNEKENQNVHGALTALKDQMEELNAALGMGGGGEGAKPLFDLDELTKPTSMTLDIRTYINRRLFAVLGEALFECQRFKSKGNEAVSTPEGEMAFIAMYIREHIAEEKENGGPGRLRGGFQRKDT